jgi:methyl-accepting chemotaxis protein
VKRLIELLRRFSRSLRGQLLLSTAAPVTLLLMVLTVVSVFSFTRLTQTLVEQRDSELVRLAAQQIADNWADSVLLLTQVAATEVVRSGDITATEQLVTGNVALLGRFDRISMTDSDGVVIVTVGGQLGENVSGRDYFDRARRLRRAVRSELYEDEAGSRLIAVAVPVYDLLGQFSGCMLGIWDLAGDTLGAPVASVQVGEGGYAYLVDENGVILYHPDAALIGTDASRHPAVAAVMAGETGARALSVSGGTTMVGYAPIPIHGLSSSLFGDQTWEGWGLLTSEMWEDIVAPLSPYVRFMAAMLTLLVALPLVVLTLSSARIAAPLQSLVTQVDRVASGEFDTTISIEATSSELRELELAFSKMVDQLRRYSDDIQNYVVSILNSQEEERKRVAQIGRAHV